MASPSRGSTTAGTEHNPLEEERRQRIEHNRAAMEAVGLLSSVQQLRQTRQPPQRPSRQASQIARRSAERQRL